MKRPTDSTSSARYRDRPTDDGMHGDAAAEQAEGPPQRPDNSTPGKPKESGSRQQSHEGQNAQTGSPHADRELTRRGGTGDGPKPPGAK